VLIIELDDKTHRRHDRSERDEFLDRAFAAAGISVLHVPAAASYNVAKLRALLAEQISSIDA
jgi:very-short-patch-repair endonuclease